MSDLNTNQTADYVRLTELTPNAEHAVAVCARVIIDASNNIVIDGANLASIGASTVALTGAIAVNDTTTPSVTLTNGSTNTGFFWVKGKTSGGRKYTTADTTAFTITDTTATQTSGNVTLTTPDFAGVNDTHVFTTLAQTLAGKTLAFVRVSTQSLSGAGAVNVTTGTTKLTTTGASQALTLADGADGQRKSIIHEVDGGSAILTPTTKTGFTTITFTAVGDSAQLEFVTTRGWMIASLNGAVAA